MLSRGFFLLFFALSLSVGCKRAPSVDAEPENIEAKPAEEDEEEASEEGEGDEGEEAEGAQQGSEPKRARRPVRKLSLDAEEVAEIFSKIPELRSLTEELRLFDEPYDINRVQRRGSQDVGRYLFSANPVLFSPDGGDPHLVIAGKSGKDAFIVALRRLPDESYELSSRLLFKNDTGPFVLAYLPNARERLLWTGCWKCRGEGGSIALDDDKKGLVITHD